MNTTFDPKVLKIIDIIVFAAMLEREHIPLTQEERELLIDSTIEFSRKIEPLYKKYGENKDV